MHTRIRRLPKFDYSGPHRYSLTICTFQSAAVLAREDVAECVCTHFVQSAREMQYAMVVYCAMPDHLHVLVDGRDATESLPLFVKRAKQMSGYYGKKIAGRRIWQPGYFDDILRPHDIVWEYVRYIAMNPVEAGLVKDPRDYRFTGSSIYSGEDLRAYIRICCEIDDSAVPPG